MTDLGRRQAARAAAQRRRSEAAVVIQKNVRTRLARKKVILSLASHSRAFSPLQFYPGCYDANCLHAFLTGQSAFYKDVGGKGKSLSGRYPQLVCATCKEPLSAFPTFGFSIDYLVMIASPCS